MNKMHQSTDLVKRQDFFLANRESKTWDYKRKSFFVEDHYIAFVRQVLNIVRLTDKEEFILGCNVQRFQDELAATKLVFHNMKLAIKIAFKYKMKWAYFMDLVQEALMGLSIAAKGWNPLENVKFGTYALFWIKAKLIKFLIFNYRLIQVGNTRLGRQVYFEVFHSSKKMLTGAVGIESKKIVAKNRTNSTEAALVLKILTTKELSLSEHTENTFVEDDIFVSEHIKNQLKEIFQRILENFEKTLVTERDKVIWKCHVISNSPVRLIDLGKKFGVSKQRVGQMVYKLKNSFKVYLLNHIGPKTYLYWLFG